MASSHRNYRPQIRYRNGGIMDFKSMIKEDNQNTFTDPEVFGEKHNIDGKAMNIIIDNNEMLEREKRYTDKGLHKKQVLFYVSRDDFGILPSAGAAMMLDGKNYRVVDSINENGIFSIALEANRT